MKVTITSLFLLCTIALFAQQKNTQSVAGTLQSATVYYGYGAELNHTAKANIGAGLQELTITGVAVQTDINTIQVSCPESVVLMSYQFSTRQVTPPTSDEVRKATDTLQLLQKQIAAVINQYAIQEDVLNRTAKLIEANVGNTPKKEISSLDLIKLIDYYTAKVEAIKTSLYALQQKQNDLQQNINAVSQRISQQQQLAGNNARWIGQIVLQLMSKSPVNADFTVSYFTRSAGWLPTYDLRMKTLDNSFKLTYKASVTQSTGIDWKNVKLNLSTSNPNLGSGLPVLNPMYISMYAPVLYESVVATAYAARAAQAKMAARQEVSADAIGNYQIKDEDEKKPANVAAFTSLTESQLNTNFEIDLPYDVPSDGKAYSVFIKEEQLKAGYQHYAVPKLDRDAFMVAQLTNWQSLDLLPGEANIIMDNVYLGKSAIEPNTTADTLKLSLGRDKRVATSRTLVKEFSKTKVRGDSKTESFTYEITVRNNKKQPIDLNVTDQVPLSKMKEVEVEIEDRGQGNLNTETGVIEWKLHLLPGESKKLRFSYSVKYPKDKTLMNHH